MLPEICDGFHRIVQKRIVAIENTYIFAQDEFRSGINRSTNPSISVVSVPCNREVRFSLPAAKKLRGFVGRAVVYDNPFEVANRLPVQALIGAVQNRRPVVGGRKDGYGGPGHFPIPPLAASPPAAMSAGPLRSASGETRNQKRDMCQDGYSRKIAIGRSAYMTDKKNARGLPAAERRKFFRHRIYAALGYQRRVPLRLMEVDGYCRIVARDGSVFCTSPKRWRFYKKGLTGCLDGFDRFYRFTALDPPPGPVLDIGAHTGEFSLLALSRGRAVYAVEPDPDALACLRRNLAGPETATIIDALVWNTEEELIFGTAASNGTSSVFIGDDSERSDGAMRRRATTLDRIAADHGIDTLAFLKVEAMGAEPEVLEGGRKLLRRTARIAVSSGPKPHSKGMTTTAACEALLREAGFAVRTIDHGLIMTLGSRDGDLSLLP